MNLETEILREHSKAQSERVAAWIGDRADRFDELIRHVLGDDEVIARRAAWIMSHCIEDQPQLMTQAHLEKLVDSLTDNQRHPAIRRNITRVLDFIPLPGDDLTGRIFEACFALLSDPGEPVASRVFSMTALKRICERHPELAPEVQLVVEDGMPHGSAAFKSRGRKTLKTLEKMMERAGR